MFKLTKHIDTLIIGQGLAGSLLGWHLMQHGHAVSIVCDQDAPSASRVAAGIFNPITGQRLVLQQQAAQIIVSANQCYQQLERLLNQRFFYPKPMLRIFKHDKEHQHFIKRQLEPGYSPYLGQYINNVEPISAANGLCEQQQTGYLDTNALLDALADYFMRHQSYVTSHFEYPDLQCTQHEIIWKNIHAQRIIFCQGFMDQHNPWFNDLPFQPAKGEILSFTSKSALPDQIINGGKWLLPLHDGSYKTGATYSHDLTNTQPTAQGKAECLLGLKKLLNKPIDVNITQHKAGIRPNTLDKNPFIGFHPKQKNIGIFNGFGSKGSMLIPYYAQAFSQHIRTHSSIPDEANILRIQSKKDIQKPEKKSRFTLTDRVHHSLLQHLNANTFAIDATAGNGHDTLFLAKVIGQHGHVFAFDIQAQAIRNTFKKLNDAKLTEHTSLFCHGHQHMCQHIPLALHGKINLIMFNLGYLPQADKAVITQTSTTIEALESAIQLIAPKGRISILAYPGHAGGEQEMLAITAWLNNIPTNAFHIIHHKALHPTKHSPVWFEIVRAAILPSAAE